MERRWLSLAALCAGTLMIILDQTVVNVALPAIAGDLGFTASGLAWVINAYLIPFGGLLLLAGRLGDLLGRKRVFLAGLAVFTVASLLCGLAWSPEVLLVARFVQGVGGAVSSAVILGMIVTLFPAARDRAKALGVYSFVQASGGSIGSLAGGVLTQSASWHWIFLINLPIGVATFLAAVRFLDDESGSGKGADSGSAVLVTAALMLGVYTIVEVESHGWGSTHTLGFGAVSVALLIAFVVRQARTPNPLLPLRILTSRSVAGANVVQVLLIAAMFGFQFLVVLYLQRVLGYDSLQAGLSMLPVAVAIGAVSLGLSARLNTRFGARRVLVAGLGLLLAGMVLLSRAPIDAGFVLDVLPAMLALGIGFGTAMPALMVLAMSDATPEDSGLTSGLVNTTAQVGGALGLSVLAVLAATRTAAAEQPTREALLSGYHLGFTVGAALVAAALVTALVWWHPSRLTSSQLEVR
ncbi:DHA2 family efflux MFS transporter permease subunit [Allokutzneria albata]|nr:DHA2 family efflux MFS transporter permease subunit [Allokutzneria albata]